MLINNYVHPCYRNLILDWEKFRLAYEGGSAFIHRYLKKFSTREEDDDFETRKEISYCSAFAASALDEVKNSIFQRITDIPRLGGTESYTAACNGKFGGVDRRGSTMDGFIGRKILTDMLVISKIGAYVDRLPMPENATRAQTKGSTPYVYPVRAEDILNWTESSDSESEFTSLLIRENIYVTHNEFGLIEDTAERYRHVRIGETDKKVHVVFYNEAGQQIDRYGRPSNEEIILNLKKIPFVLFNISKSLMTNIADYQIALMNLNSSDINYGVHANFPFYTEQADALQMMSGLLRASESDTGTGTEAATAKPTDVNYGSITGRRYGKGLERPQFIHPSPEPLMASMEKEEQMKREIRELINLNISALSPRSSSSAESKQMDMTGLESGLSYIGLELENGERQLAQHWAAYEGTSTDVTINYPKRYNIKTDSDRREESKAIVNQIKVVPSKRYQKILAKKLVRVNIGYDVSVDELEEIYKEIDSAEVVVCDPDIVRKDVESGYLSKELAAKIRLYPEGDVAKAEEEHRARVIALAEAQAAKQGPTASAQDNQAARGNPDGSAAPKQDAAKEKKAARDTTFDPVPTDKTRGPAK